MEKTKKISVRDISYTALGAALIAVCSLITVPGAIPFTMQTFGVFTSSGLLGAKKGTLSVIVYILLGVIGLPVFSSFRSGPGVLIGPTGGYIVGFIFSALICGALSRKGTGWLILGEVLALIACYAFGSMWYMIWSGKTAYEVFFAAVAPFLGVDAVKIALSVFTVTRLKKTGIF